MEDNIFDGDYDNILIHLIDIIIADCDFSDNFYASEETYPDGSVSYECTLKLKSIDYGSTEVKYKSSDGKIENCLKGIDIIHKSGFLEEISIHNYKYMYTNNQKMIIKNFLDSTDNYKRFLDAKSWFSRNNVFRRINELLKDGVIEWEELKREKIGEEELGIGHESYLLTYEAEYGDYLFEYSFLEDPEEILDLKEEADEYDDPGAFIDYISVAPKLTIKVGDYYCHTIYELNDNEEKLLKDEFEEENSYIQMKDVLIRTSNAKCTDRDHVVDKIKAYVYLMDKTTLKKKLHEIDAYFCRNCHRYYILERDYKYLKTQGIICCRVINVDGDGNNYKNWKEKSLLNTYGYSVSKKHNLSDKTRHALLDMIIENGIISKKDCIRHIEFVLESHCNLKNSENAISKWNNDLNYLRNGKNIKGYDFKLGNIFEKK